MPRLAASVTMMFNEWDLLDRFEQAARVGFEGVRDSGALRRIGAGHREPRAAAQSDGNAHERAGGRRGDPGREQEYRDGLNRAFEYAEAAGCGQLHCLAGRTDDPRAEDTFVANLEWGSERARPLGIRLLLEPLNTQDNPGLLSDRVGPGAADHRAGGRRQHLPAVRLLPHADHGGVPGRNGPVEPRHHQPLPDRRGAGTA